MTSLKTIIKKHFVSGLLVTVPLIVTYLVLRFLFTALDGLLGPVARRLLGYDVPGLGVAVTVLIILLAGIFATNYIGAELFRRGDGFLRRTPLVRIIYTAARQLVQSMAAPTTRAFSEAALVEYPRKGMYAIGFLSGRSCLRSENIDKDVRLVFIPSTPTPFTGLVVFVPLDDIYPLKIGVEEAVKILVSGGIVTPSLIEMESVQEMCEV